MLNALSTAESPSNLQQIIDYGARTDGQPVYVGFANRGLATTADGWQIQFFTYTTISSNDYLSTRTLATGAWSNRAGLTYA